MVEVGDGYFNEKEVEQKLAIALTQITCIAEPFCFI